MEGEFKNGRPHGKGKYSANPGQAFDVKFDNGKQVPLDSVVI